MKNNSHFRKGSGVVTCTICQRQTRETGNGESNYELCAQCIELSQMENRHADHNHAGEFWDCEDCIGDLSQQAKEYLDVYRKAQAGEVKEPRRCYFISELDRDENGEFIPCIAVEGEPGYYKTDWHWGKDKELAEQCADEMNQGLGISKKEAMKIQFSTMRII